MRCSMTGMPIADIGDAIFEDGEWVSWDYIHGQLRDLDLPEHPEEAGGEVLAIFEALVSLAQEYFYATGRYLQIWGELGELYAEAMFGIKRHAPGHAGSDGRVGNDWVEIKTISPEKSGDTVLVKRAGNFNKLLIIRIDEDFRFRSLLIDRKQLGKGTGKYARATWTSDARKATPLDM